MSKPPAWFLAIGLVSCGVTSPFGRGSGSAKVSAEDFVEAESAAKGADLDSLWERAGQVLTAKGYAVDSVKTRFADREIVTLWNAVLGMNRYEGYRTRAWVRFHKADKGDWKAAVCVQRQRNTDIRNPSEISLAQWEDLPADKSAAELILWKIESAFRPSGADEPPK